MALRIDKIDSSERFDWVQFVWDLPRNRIGIFNFPVSTKVHQDIADLLTLAGLRRIQPILCPNGQVRLEVYGIGLSLLGDLMYGTAFLDLERGLNFLPDRYSMPVRGATRFYASGFEADGIVFTPEGETWRPSTQDIMIAPEVPADGGWRVEVGPCAGSRRVGLVNALDAALRVKAALELPLPSRYERDPVV